MALVALLCACMWSLYQVLMRVVGRTPPPLATLFYPALIGAVAITVIGPFDWRAPDARGWALFVPVAVLGASGHYLLMQLAPASVLQPFAYAVLVWATIDGCTMFAICPIGSPWRRADHRRERPLRVARERPRRRA